ncbi:uncharacterized protein [Macrobrachium rosenbergii]|uniref:uncharacterized protein n=1 Tax=Macrobrachium rosenbergii TaxID=79674 RepID=UPI0034D73BCE
MERDKRGLHLAAGGVILTLLAFVAGLVAAVTSNWATFTGAMSGNFGPWSICQDAHNVCRRVSSTFPSTWASSVTGAGSIGCAILSDMCIIRISDRHAVREMVCIAAGALCGFLSIIFFVLEIFIFGVGSRSGLYVNLSWSFYLQIRAVVKLTRAQRPTTISGPAPENGHANHHANRSSSRNSSSRGRSHRNANGVAMTHMSGLPYMVTANGNGHLGYRNNGGVAFDPNKTPLRSSLKRSKVPNSEDSADATTMGIQNLAFTQSSPPSKKKVRIHTHSTPV